MTEGLQKQNLASLSLAELTEYVKSLGEGAFRAKQIYGWF